MVVSINGQIYTKALIIVRSISNKEFCQSILLTSNSHLKEIQAFLNCYEGIDFFSIRAVDYTPCNLDNLVLSYGDGIRVVVVEPFESISLQISGFYGDENSEIEVSEIKISAVDGSYVSMSPDPDRNVADQMYLTKKY